MNLPDGTVMCPVCAEGIAVPMSTTELSSVDETTVQLFIEPDLDQVWRHLETHGLNLYEMVSGR